MEKQLREIILEAGDILLEARKSLSSLDIHVKKGEGLVSEADLKTEKFLRDKIGHLFPDHYILSEENSFQKEENLEVAKNSEHCWYIDPLDGTHNFLSGLDYYCISIGYSLRGQLKFGIVYAPTRKELYIANKGKGAFFYDLREKTEKKLDVKKNHQKDFEESMFVTCLNSLGGKNKKKLELFYQMNKQALSVRRFGSAALDLCLTAAGQFDGFWEHGLKPWDINAGALICEETGLQVTDFEQKAFNPFSETIVAISKHLSGRFYPIIKEHFL
ncbi:MAG: inositol monophosphatase [Halobacteriovoraceae bacterium]|nr:inositol monophosphatase [Halobacteriovoraceae bacterium]MCB9095646.1 inositol monophosphatase [Halobacteriovoraceae bacterium]